MKTCKLMVISFLLVALTTTSNVLGEDNDVVFDQDGSPVKTGVPYFISYMSMDYHMWICRMRFGTSDPKSCPQQPVMFTDPTIAPTPVMFLLSPPTTDNIVREAAKLSIKFVNPLQCGESGIWRVVQRSSLEGEVVLNGNNFSSDSTFTIHTTNEYYMLRYGDGYEATTISLSDDRGGKQRLLSKRYSGEMEIYIYPAKR